MSQDDQDKKIDALAAMAGGQDIARDGFNAVEHIPDPDEDHPSKAAEALAAQTGQNAPSALSDVPAAAPTAPQAIAPSASRTSGARKSRAAAMQKYQARANAQQFKRMMVPILLITGLLLLFLGAVVLYLMRDVPDTGTGSFLHNPKIRRIMVITSFVLGPILMGGAWMFRSDVKRSEAAARIANARDDEA